MYERLDEQTLQTIGDTAAKFAEGVVRPLLVGDAPVPEAAGHGAIIEAAASAGLLAPAGESEPTPSIWGAGAAIYGPEPSLVILRKVAAVSADVAFQLHAAGLAGAVDSAGAGETALALGGGPVWFGAALQGETPEQYTMVCLPEGATRVLAAAAPDEWATFGVSDNAEVSEVGRTLGLRGCRWVNVAAGKGETFSGAVSPKQALPLHWLGTAAIALGVSDRAAAIARDYAAQRRQGGRLIIEHAAVKALLGKAAAGRQVQEALLSQAAGCEPGPGLLRLAALVKSSGTEAACLCVTNALQCLGGNGYMEDYGVEQALRDVQTLRVLHGTPERLRMLVAELDRS